MFMYYAQCSKTLDWIDKMISYAIKLKLIESFTQCETAISYLSNTTQMCCRKKNQRLSYAIFINYIFPWHKLTAYLGNMIKLIKKNLLSKLNQKQICNLLICVFNVYSRITFYTYVLIIFSVFKKKMINE